MDKIKKKRVAEYSAIVIIFALFAIFFIKNIHLRLQMIMIKIKKIKIIMQIFQ